jgi:hypothetical protein
MAGKIDA